VELRDARRDPRALSEVVREVVTPGSSVYIGNFGAQLFVVGDELVRQGLSDLDVIAGSGGLVLDKLIGAGTARSVLFAHCWNPVGPRPAWNLRRATEGDGSSLVVRELSLGMLSLAFQASAWNVPFLPVSASEETGYRSEDWSDGLLTSVDSPFGPALVVGALRPDVAFIHADTVDALGNAVVRTPYGEHLVAAQAARTTVVVAESFVAAPDRLERPADLAGIHVDAIVVMPGAVAPDGAPSRYPRDIAAYVDYAELTSDAERFAASISDLRSSSAS
jgi:glutaconate CoA-transferase subunit A